MLLTIHCHFSVLSNQSGLNPYRQDLDSPPYQTAASIPTLSTMRVNEQQEKIEVQLLPQVVSMNSYSGKPQITSKACFFMQPWLMLYGFN